MASITDKGTYLGFDLSSQKIICSSLIREMASKTNTGTYLGFDLGTQKLKGVQLGPSLEVIAVAEVKFDSDLPEYRTTGGVNQGKGQNEFFAHPVMWVKAIDIVLDRLVVQGADLCTVAGISASGQQHGSVYWSCRGIETLQNLDPDKFLHAQLDDSAYTVTQSPIWMDGSTEKQCLEMETAIGGRDKMVEITGSKCYQRFTGPQIRKIYQTKARAYEETPRISLVSSFVSSIFLGDVAPIDYADGSGMNLFDINKKEWSQVCLNACAPDLEQRLCAAQPTCSIAGNVSDFFVQRYGFPADCKVACSTGDNPSALSGMLLQKNWLTISLGTSDTVLMNLEKHPKLAEGHVMCHPTTVEQYWGMLCFRNGSFVRDHFKKVEANDNWDNFNELLNSTPRGNHGNMALHFNEKEIIPNVKGSLRWNKDHKTGSPDAEKGVTKFSSPQIEIRALIEGQMLHHKAIALDMGFNFGEHTKIIATGGASVNKPILQVISDVFNAPVYTQKEAESAMMGAAFRAKYAVYLHENGAGDLLKQKASNQDADDCNEEDTKSIMNYSDYIIQFIPNHLQRICEPSKDSEAVYNPMLKRYNEMAKILLSQYKAGT